MYFGYLLEPNTKHLEIFLINGLLELWHLKTWKNDFTFAFNFTFFTKLCHKEECCQCTKEWTH